MEEIKLADPEKGNDLTINLLKSKEELDKLEVLTDKSLELKSILSEILIKIEECTLSIADQPLLEQERVKPVESNSFKKPMFDDKPAMNLGTFGKGKKRAQKEAEKAIDEQENIKPEDTEITKETEGSGEAELTDSKLDIEQGIHKLQKTEEA